MSDSGGTLPKFGEWDVNDPTSAEGYTMIFNKARDEKKTGGKSESPVKVDPSLKHQIEAGKPQAATSLILLFSSGRKNGFVACKIHTWNLDKCFFAKASIDEQLLYPAHHGLQSEQL